MASRHENHYPDIFWKVKTLDKNIFAVYPFATMSLIDQVAIKRQAKNRLRKIIKMRKQKMSLEAIGLALNISKQRVWQILKGAKNGIGL